jgi:hypothetical protein
MSNTSQTKITLDSLKDLPARKVRQAFVYLNARRYGLSGVEAKHCAVEWHKVMTRCFTQAVAGELYNTSNVRAVNFPKNRNGRELYTTAHFSAYTIVSIVLAHSYNRPVYILVGQPPIEWEQTLVSSLADAGVNGTVIKSNFSQLKRIKRAIEEDAIIISLIDVPWHRDNSVPNREYQSFNLGAGKILASHSIFKIANKLGLEPTFILCEPTSDGFDVVHHGNLSQQECFEKLAAAVDRAPEHFERFCELQQYYEGGNEIKEIVTFQLGENRYIVDSTRKKYWMLGEKLSAYIDTMTKQGSSELEITKVILNQIHKLIGHQYDEVIYL